MKVSLMNTMYIEDIQHVLVQVLIHCEIITTIKSTYASITFWGLGMLKEFKGYSLSQFQVYSALLVSISPTSVY